MLNELLLLLVTSQEVKHIIFFRNYWDIVATDIWSLVAEAFGTGTINPDLANTLVVPIPKIDSLTKDFKPISLCNVTLKIISKVFVNHIRPYLDNLIGSLQSSFIPNQGTIDMLLLLRRLRITCTRGKTYFMQNLWFPQH